MGKKKATATKKTAKKETVKKAAKKKTTKRKSRKKKAVELKEKLMWAIYSPTMKHVENFEFHDKNSAEKRKEVLSKMASRHTGSRGFALRLRSQSKKKTNHNCLN